MKKVKLNRGAKIIVAVISIFLIFILMTILREELNQKDIITFKSVKDKSGILTSVSLSPNLQKITPGREIFLKITIIRIDKEKSNGLEDILVQYSLKDKNGIIMSLGSQTAALATQASTIETIYLQKDMKPGNYLILVEVRNLYTGELLSTASESITIEKKGLFSEILARIRI